MLQRIVLTLIIVASTSTFALNKNENKRYLNLTKEIRCVVCQGQSIADSNATIARDMRHKVRLLLEKKNTDSEIRDYLATRYGEFILLRPRLNKTTWLLWGFPFIALILAIGIFFYRYRSKRNPRTPQENKLNN